MPILPFLLIGLGSAALIIGVLTSGDGPVPDHPPDLPPNAPPPSGMPKSTRYRLVDAILSNLKAAAESSGIPLGLLVGWIAKESGGKIGEVTSLGERGYFQLIPDEQKATGFTDTNRLSSDRDYSINAGLALIGIYMGKVDKLSVAAKGSSYYWRLVKLAHTMGTGAMDKIVAAAQAAGQARTWDMLEEYALANDGALLSATKHSPAKWFPFIDSIYQLGQPFGFGTEGASVVGGVAPAFTDIPDPLDCLLKS